MNHNTPGRDSSMRPMLWETNMPELREEPVLVCIDSGACEEMYDCPSLVHTELCYNINTFQGDE